MTKFQYNRKMAWASFWLWVWGALQLIGIYPSLKTKWFAWVVSQTGFSYMEPWNPDIHENWPTNEG